MRVLRYRTTTSLLTVIFTLTVSMSLRVDRVGAQSDTPVSHPESDVALLAEGETPSSTGTDVAWRVVQDVAEPQGQAQNEARALGFGVPIDEPILTTDVENGRVMEFGPGEAFYIADESTTRRESLSDEATPYYRIALVPAPEAADAGGDTMVLAGEPWTFNGDPSSFMLRAIGGTVRGSDAVAFPNINPTLLLVLEGSMQVLPNAIDMTVDAGEAAVLPANVSAAGSIGIRSADGEDARFVVVSVQYPDQRAFSIANTGALTVEVRLGACPDGVPVARVGANPGSAGPLCGNVNEAIEPAPLAEARVGLANVETGDHVEGVTNEEGVVTFADLPPGAHELVVPEAGAAASRCTVLAVGDLDYVNLVLGASLDLGDTVTCVAVAGDEMAS